MRLSLKARQVAAVTSIVGFAVIVLGAVYVTGVARVRLEETRARGVFLANAIYHRARDVVAASAQPYAALRSDPGLRSILESSVYSENVTYAAIVDASEVVVAHSDSACVGQAMPARPGLDALLADRPWAQVRAIYADAGRMLEIQQPLLMGGSRFGTIRVGVSMLLARADLGRAMRPAVLTALAALGLSSLIAMILAQSLLRPIHLIRSGLSRLGRGEFGVKLDLPREDELGELGGFFNTVSERISADRSKLEGETSRLESIVGRLEDAVAFFAPGGELLFGNPAMSAALPAGLAGRTLAEIWPDGDPCRSLVEQTASDGQSRGPVAIDAGAPGGGHRQADGSAGRGRRLVMTHAIEDGAGRTLGVMLVSRDLGYIGEVESTLQYSRKVAALGRLTAGVAHEIKNSLHAATIHLELVKQDLGAGGPRAQPVDREAAAAHVASITATLKRLDEMLQGLLTFTRPEELKLQEVGLAAVVGSLMPIVRAEAGKTGVEIAVDCPEDLPMLRADPGALQQALLNLALNACQAMPGGGRLRMAGHALRDRRVEIVVEDTGAGIPPEHLDQIFNLYFTTRQGGTGIGLSMVYRTIQLHDGEIEVQSSPGRGTTFRITLPCA
ncbi:MAG TPA: ATP-binding protein [Vicinamibacterales bacterium]|mgnify:CR=1 FL=1|nr:ATP-binding protein [Vicinamibacterales bacterium]HPW19770.1 ATP-binding protein [Vicinamibacterales bacterium]